MKTNYEIDRSNPFFDDTDLKQSYHELGFEDIDNFKEMPYTRMDIWE